MSNEIAIRDQIALSNELAKSNLLPGQYHGNPANLLYAVQYSQALGVHPIAAVNGIHVIKGKPTASAQLIAGLVRRAGHTLRIKCVDHVATATIIRKDDPTFEFTATWDMARAKDAGLAGSETWKKYQDSMLKARATTEVARDACSEVLFGIIYTAEEMGATEVDEDGAFTGTVTVETSTGWAEATKPAPAPAIPEFDNVDAARAYWVERSAAGATKAELDDIAAIAKALKELEPVDAEIVEDTAETEAKIAEAIADVTADEWGITPEEAAAPAAPEGGLV